MQSFLQNMIFGIGIGCIYGLVGLTFTAIWNAGKVINFAQGEFLMLGALVGFFCITTYGLPIPLAFIAVIVLLTIVGAAFEFLLVTPLIKRRTPAITMMIGTMGAAMVISGTVGVVTRWQWLPVKPFLGSSPWQIGDFVILPQYALVILVTLLLVIGFRYLLKRTLWGMALRATGFNSELAVLSGIKTSKMVMLAFVISACMAGIGGLTVAPITSPEAHMGLPLVIKGFIACILGGLGNPYGAVLGGIMLGVITCFIAGYSSAIAEISTFGVLIVILIFLPQGIFGAREE